MEYGIKTTDQAKNSMLCSPVERLKLYVVFVMSQAHKMILKHQARHTLMSNQGYETARKNTAAPTRWTF